MPASVCAGSGGTNLPDIRKFLPLSAPVLTSRVDEEVSLLAPHRPGRADFPHPVPHMVVSLKDAFQMPEQSVAAEGEIFSAGD